MNGGWQYTNERTPSIEVANIQYPAAIYTVDSAGRHDGEIQPRVWGGYPGSFRYGYAEFAPVFLTGATNIQFHVTNLSGNHNWVKIAVDGVDKIRDVGTPVEVVIALASFPQSITFTPDYPYNNWLANYTNPYITYDLPVVPPVPLPTYAIVASADAHGLITPVGTLIFNQGDNAAYLIIPDAHYEIDDIIVDGSSAGAVSYYTFTNIQSAHMIRAIFKEVHVTASIRILKTKDETSFPLPASAKRGETIMVAVDVTTDKAGAVSVELLPPTGTSVQSWADALPQPAGHFVVVLPLQIQSSNVLGVGHLLPHLTETVGEYKTFGSTVNITILAAGTIPPPPPPKKSSNGGLILSGIGAFLLAAVTLGKKK